MSTALLDAPRVRPAVHRPAAHRPTGAASVPASAADRARRLPVPVGAAAALAVVQAVALLAVGLTGLDGVFGIGRRPDGMVVATSLLLLAGWVVLCAGGGACLLDGAGRRLLAAVACAEILLLLVVAVAGALDADGVWLVALGRLGALPVPALALLALGVPTAKLLLAGSPSAVAWVQAGGRPRAPRPTPAVEHRLLRGLTLGCIGLVLTAVAVVGAPAGPPTPSTTAAVVVAP